MDFMISMNGGQTFAPGSAPAFAEVMVSSRMDYLGTRYFDTEMLMLNIGGGPGLSILPQLMLRESPTRASLGRTSVRQDPLTRDYMISSFFDIFTELSLDGGRTWEPATTGLMTVFLMPTNLPPPPERDYFTYSQGKINLLIGTQVERVLVGGPTEVRWTSANGEASDADNDGLDDVRTRITGLNLMGTVRAAR
jgi:hypothetical protein